MSHNQDQDFDQNLFLSFRSVQCFSKPFLIVNQHLSVSRQVTSAIQSSQFFVINQNLALVFVYILNVDKKIPDLDLK